MNRHNGFTLIELLISLAVLISLTAIAVPNLVAFTIKTRVDNEISRLYRLLQLTRNSAINSGTNATLCPLVNGSCINNWNLPLFAFIDHNNNKSLDKNLNETILSIKPAVTKNDKLQYRKGGVAITYSASGHLSSWGQNGTFKYCPFNNFDKSQGIIIATSGRIYKSFQNAKGTNINRSSNVIICN